jgi:O-antigen ligase
MSSLSLAEPRTPALPVDMVRVIAVLLLCGFAVFTQLDAVSNKVSGGSPISVLALMVAGVPGTAFLLLLSGGQTSRAKGLGGARLIAVLMLWTVVCWTLSAHKTEGYDYLVKFATAVLPAMCLLLIADRPWHLHLILWSMIGAGAFASVVVILESRSGTRIFSTAMAAVTADFEGVARSAGASDQNPTTAAQMLMTSVALALGLLFSGEKRLRLVLAGVVVLGAAALALMSARSAILGFGAGAGIVLLSLRKHKAFPLILVATGIAGAVGLMFAPPTLWERFAAIGDFGKDQTLFRRVSYLRIGADLIGKSPIWGVGPGNFPLYYVTDAYRWMPGRIPFPRELHNTYLDVMTELGVVGFAICACLITHCLLQLRRALAGSPELARVSFAVLVGLVALLVGCFFMPHKDMRYLWLMIALAIQCGRIRSGEIRAGESA